MPCETNQIMKKFFTIIFLSFSALTFAQGTGSIVGVLTDKDYNNEPLAFANVIIKGTSTGTTSDMDGLYEIANLSVGSYTIVYSFVGYETVEIPNVVVEANKVTSVNVPMGASAAALDEVIIKTTVRRESEVALLLEQKKASIIKESIGAAELNQLGISNASGATSKISGVSKKEGSGEIYVRGLGDRYLSTTLNGLPIPSDNIDKKNIDLVLFPTRFIQNVSVSKTFSSNTTSDLASGNIDIVSKEVTSRRDIAASVSAGVNSNVAANGIFDNFKVTVNNDDINLGLYSRSYSSGTLVNAITNQGWDPLTVNTPVNHGFGFNIGGIIGEQRKLRLYFSGGQAVNHEYREGLFREFDQGSLRDNVPEGDNRNWLRSVNNTGMFHAEYKLNDNNNIKFNSFVVNKTVEETYEAGRERTTEIFEELDNIEEGSQFVRDQNIKDTFVSVTQLLGAHNFSEKNTLEWAVGYNFLTANEPNRVRNELNILNDNPNTVVNEDGIIAFGFTGGFQQRKSVQEITDNEVSARINDKIILKQNEDGDEIYTLNVGANFRNKTREFNSQFFGVVEGSGFTVNPETIDNLTDIFTQENFNNGSLELQVQDADFYDGELTSIAGFADFTGVFNKFIASGGLRFQDDAIDVSFDVGNFVNQETGQARIGTSNKSYSNLYPYLNLKYSFTEKLALRVAGSFSQTLPEFKEIAPFQYVDPLGQVFQGNPNLERSQNVNVDLKLEFFPESNELLSFSAFYKGIEDPINRGLQRGGEGIFSYFNTGERARVLGVEVEGRYYIIKKSENNPSLRIAGNASYINHEQDLRDALRPDGTLEQTFKYDGKETIGLEGASDFITNLSLTLTTGEENPYEITISGNYASDRIFALGSPRNQQEPDVFFNGEIIEKGFVTLDLILNKNLTDKLSLSLTAQNLLNPTIERTQNNQNIVSGVRTEDSVLTYTTGINTSLNLTYKF